MENLEKELADLLNRYHIDAASGTPDFVLSKYLIACLDIFNMTVLTRERLLIEESRIVKPS